MHLVVFDIDGTLTRTVGVDDACFERALADVLGLRGIDTDWGTYRHVTDTGLVTEAVQRATGQPATPAQVAAVRTRFVELLEAESRRSPGAFAPVAGAADAVSRLKRLPGHAVALATGSWSASAQIKLRTSGLGDLLALPLGTSDDAVSREGVVTHAAALALGRSGATESQWSSIRAEFTSVVCAGDGVWDARTAATLGAGFVAVRCDGDFSRFEPMRVPHRITEYTARGGVEDVAALFASARGAVPRHDARNR